MTDLEPYSPAATPAVAEAVDSWVDVLAPVGDLASLIAATDFVPQSFRGKPAAVAAAILYGREVGLPPMTTLKNTYVVHGTPDLSAEAQRALVFAAGHEIEFVETTATRCKMRGRRRGSETWVPASYTIDEAKTSGDFAKNSNYRTRAQEMLVARCTSRLCSMAFPDVVGGFSASVSIPLDEQAPAIAAQAEPAAATTTVTRKPAPKATVRKPAPKAPALEAPAGPVGEPPLPGEDGYEELGGQAEEPPRATPAQVKAIHAALNGTREDKLRQLSDLLGREVGSSKDLTRAEASQVIDALKERPAEPEDDIADAELVDDPLTDEQSARIGSAAKALGLSASDLRAICTEVVGRDIARRTDLTGPEAETVLAHLEALTGDEVAE